MLFNSARPGGGGGGVGWCSLHVQGSLLSERAQSAHERSRG